MLVYNLRAAQPMAVRRAEVARAYLDILGREADDAGLAAWSASPLSIDAVRAGLEASPEGQAVKAARMRQYLMLAAAAVAVFLLMRRR